MLPSPATSTTIRSGKASLHADGRRESVAHRPEAARGDEGVGVVVLVELGCPHLVLAHLGRDDGLALRHLVERLDDALGLDDLAVLAITERGLFLPGLDQIQPVLALRIARRVVVVLEEAVDVLQGALRVAHDRQVHDDVLVDRRGVHVDVDDLGVGRKGVDLARHAVVKAGPDADEKIAVADGHVGEIGAVHARHAEKERVRAREGAEAHEGRCDRELGPSGEGPQLIRCLAQQDASAGHQHGPFRGPQHLQELDVFLGGRLGRQRQLCGVDLDLRGVVVHLRGDDVFRQIDEHRPGTARAGDVEGLVDGVGQLVGIANEIVVLGAGTGDAGDVALLEGVVADEVRGHLPREDDDGDGVHVGRGDPRHGVRGAGAGGGKRHADLSRCAGIAVGGVYGRLFVADEDVLEFAAVQLVIDVDDGTARVSEHDVHSLRLQALDQNLGSFHFHRDYLLR